MKQKIVVFFALIFSLNFTSCTFFNTVKEAVGEKDYDAEITAVTLKSNTLSINRNESEYLTCTLTPSTHQNKCSVSWSYDEDYISVTSDKYGAIITGKKVGSTYIKASCNGIIATCLLSITADGEVITGSQYIYSNYSVVEMQPGDAQTITASLYGGNTADMENFEWSIADDSIASISYSRNNCVVTAKKTGSTTLTASHPDSTYDYSFVIYVYTDALTQTYITTNYNILTIDRNSENSKNISVDLVNPISAAYKNGFTWNYEDEDSKNIISVSANLNTAEIVPLKNGVAKLVVSHENAEYDLNIIVRVTTVVENTHIAVSPSTLIINGSDTAYTITASVENYDGYVDPEEFEWYIPEESKELLTSYTASGNTLRLVGYKNGSFKIKCSHQLAEYSRNVLVILQNQVASAQDSSMYITTDQNYVTTQFGAEQTVLSVRLVGGEEGDEQNFNWAIDGYSVSSDKLSNPYCDIDYVTGSVSARSAVTSGTSATGYLYITPFQTGTPGSFNITISHPDCLYTCEITVKVYSEYALLKDPVTISTSSSLVKLINGNTTNVTAELANASDGDENNITWESSDSTKVSVSPTTGSTTVITACGSGSNQTYVTADFEDAYASKKILVLTADTQEDLETMKGFYSDSSYLRVSAGETRPVSVTTFCLETTDIISWTSSDNSIFTVNADTTSSNYCSATVTGVSSGTAILTASLSGCTDISWNVTVVPTGESADVIENPKYLTTNLNAVVLDAPSEDNPYPSSSLSVTGVNIDSTDMSLYTNWIMEDQTSVDTSISDSIFEISGNPGESVTLTALQPGKSVITVSNKYSANSLKINAKCGSLYEWSDDYIVYISTESDVFNIVNGSTTTIAASLVNTDSEGSFSWKVSSGSENVEIIGLASGTCSVTGIQAGQAIIEISNTLSEYTKEILINVANSEEELNGFIYLTTSTNVVTVGEECNKTVSVSVENTTNNIISGFTWRSTDSSICTVSSSGSVAVIYGHACGTCKVIVEQSSCSYPLEIIVNVVDPIAVNEDPYITCNNIATCYVGGDNVTLAAELVGGNSSDTSSFTWSIADSSIATLYASNDSAQIKGLKAGITQVIISHPKAFVSRTVLIIVEEQSSTNYYITVTESIIKMAPDDDEKTITATLVNGDDDDVYDFVWWADSYDKINMNYTGQYCVIEPIASGCVTIHCSHPKAANSKDIVLYISNYSDFAFSSTNITLTTGTDTFIDMEVPATGVDCVVSYSSSDSSVCTAWGNTSVCTLHPGSLSEGVNSASCTITATLMTKSGVTQATAKLLVVVQKADASKPYIAIDGNTIITLNKDAKKTLTAHIYGASSNMDSSLIWEISNTNGTIAEFITSKNYGSEVQIQALLAGKCTVTISSDSKVDGQDVNPLTVYLIVNGISDPTITLSSSNAPLYIGEDTFTLTASVSNDNGGSLSWSVVNNDNPSVVQTAFTITYKGSKALIAPEEVGSATVYCNYLSGIDGSVISTASCLVTVSEPENIKFFVYADENSKSSKTYPATFQLYPGESKVVHYETVPIRDSIAKYYTTDSNYFGYEDLGYGANYNSVSYDDSVGTIVLTGKTSEGTASLTLTSESGQSDSISISNTYGNLFTLSKSIISATPAEVKTDGTVLYVDYSIRPACSKIIITPTSTGSSSNLYLEGYTKNADGGWTISSHNTSSDDYSYTGVATGTLKFITQGEVNCTLTCEARNYNVITSSGSSSNNSYISVGSQSLQVKVYYEKHSFTPKITRRVPYYNNGSEASSSFYSSNDTSGGFSYYDSTTNTIYLGDGEHLTGTVTVNENDCNVQIQEVVFEKDSSTSSTLALYTKGTYNTVCYNTSTFRLYHSVDYGSITYQVSPSDSSWNVEENFYRTVSTPETESSNTTIQASSCVGYLTVYYYSMATLKTNTYKIPVIVRARHCPCMTNSYYKWKD